MNRILIGLIAVVFLGASAAPAARIVLKDGTVLEGVVIRQQDGYWIKTPDDKTRMVSDDDVASVTMDNPDGDGSDSAAASSEAFRSAHGRAQDAPTALAAVSVWQQFIDKYPDSSDLPQAKSELQRWKSLAADGAEKINDKWVSGPERRKIVEQAAELTAQALDMLEQKQTLAAIDKLQQSVRLYPNSFLTNFALGDVAMFQKNYDSAINYYRAAAKLSPQSAAAMNNLAVATFFSRRWEAGITGFQQAAQIEDSKMVAQNLVTALATAPQDIRTMPRLRPTVEASNLLASKYEINGPSADFYLMPAPAAKGEFKSGGGPSGYGWSGTGFFITDDGLILTNRHVAKGAKTLLVLSGDQQSSADVVAIDDEYDLALIRIKPKGKDTFVHLSASDSPHEGADCTVMGFPLIQKLGADIKITRGIISSDSTDAGNGADVLIDAKVNPGNSGGPIIDKFGNVMAIVCMKSFSSQMEESYGIGISAGHIRAFLAKHHITLPPTESDTPTLSTEDIVTKVKPATVCILATP